MKYQLDIWRDQSGVPHVVAAEEAGAYWGLGYVHGKDRGMQLLYMRILGQGRVSELLDASDNSLLVDKFFRRMNWSGHTGPPLAALNGAELANLDAYCEGVNAAIFEKVPWEYKMLGYQPEPWTREDCLLLARMLGYLTLAQSQAEMELLFVEMVQAGVEEPMLEELFPGILGGLDAALIKQVTLGDRMVPNTALWGTGAPRMMASNNWVLSGAKTASGKPMVANDPHLEINRLPNIWSEAVLSWGENYAMGGTMPGLPGVLTGRTNHFAWGVTYAFIDAVDSWMEKCRDGCYYRQPDDQWIPFRQREELILRKKKPAETIIFYENDHGVLDGDPTQEGIYLATRWAAGEAGAKMLSMALGVWGIHSVADSLSSLGAVESGWDFVAADNDGDIAFQMSGLVPRRRPGVSGFVPLPGWLPENDWDGFHDPADMPVCRNPESGFFATANHDLNQYGKFAPINMPMGSYRAERINQLLAEGEKHTAAQMGQMQYDVYSLQAERFMEILRPLLPMSLQGEILRQWDLCYDADSLGAFLFEQVYQALYLDVFGAGMGEELIKYLNGETGSFIDFYQNFDRVLLAEESLWFGGRGREQLYREAAAKALQVKPVRWGDQRQFTMSHILFGGTIPGFFGFDRGPETAIGGRATIHQGQLYRSAGRQTSFLPSIRVIADLAEDVLLTNLAGGPSDRRWSKYYVSDMANWREGKFKRLSTDPHQSKKKL